jgi:hypothetical protein
MNLFKLISALLLTLCCVFAAAQNAAKVFVTGEVLQAQAVDLPETEEASESLAAALRAAGGVGSRADHSSIQVFRATTGQVERGDSLSGPLQPGDTVFVPRAEVVRTVGTKEPVQPWSQGMTVEAALQKLGVGRDNRVAIHRVGQPAQQEVSLGDEAAKALLATTLQPDDVLVVRPEQRATVSGALESRRPEYISNRTELRSYLQDLAQERPENLRVLRLRDGTASEWRLSEVPQSETLRHGDRIHVQVRRAPVYIAGAIAGGNSPVALDYDRLADRVRLSGQQVEGPIKLHQVLRAFDVGSDRKVYYVRDGFQSLFSGQAILPLAQREMTAAQTTPPADPVDIEPGSLVFIGPPPPAAGEHVTLAGAGVTQGVFPLGEVTPAPTALTLGRLLADPRYRKQKADLTTVTIIRSGEYIPRIDVTASVGASYPVKAGDVVIVQNVDESIVAVGPSNEPLRKPAEQVASLRDTFEALKSHIRNPRASAMPDVEPVRRLLRELGLNFRELNSPEQFQQWIMRPVNRNLLKIQVLSDPSNERPVSLEQIIQGYDLDEVLKPRSILGVILESRQNPWQSFVQRTLGGLLKNQKWLNVVIDVLGNVKSNERQILPIFSGR